VLWRYDVNGRTAAELVDEETHLTLTVYEPGEAAAVRLPFDVARGLAGAIRVHHQQNG
jgi:hypothetical protein